MLIVVEIAPHLTPLNKVAVLYLYVLPFFQPFHNLSHLHPCCTPLWNIVVPLGSVCPQTLAPKNILQWRGVNTSQLTEGSFSLVWKLKCPWEKRQLTDLERRDMHVVLVLLFLSLPCLVDKWGCKSPKIYRFQSSGNALGAVAKARQKLSQMLSVIHACCYYRHR